MRLLKTVITAVTAFCIPAAAQGFLIISQDKAAEMMAGGGIIVLDVRTAAEHREIRIPGSILIPVNEILSKASEILTNKDATILVYCRRGNRSKVAANQLTLMGYTNVYEFGGINTWKYETVTGED